MRVWDLNDGSELGKYEVAPTWVTAVAFSPDGRSVAVGDMRGNLTIRDVATGNAAIELQWKESGRSEQAHITAIAFARDGRMLIASSGRSGSKVRFWDVTTGEALGVIDPQADIVRDIAFSPDEKTLALACHPGVVKRFNVKRTPDGE